MALVVFLRGVNVGGHKTFRPAALAKELKALDAVNIGAAGTFVIRRPPTRGELRAELKRRLPFDTEVMICEGREIVRILSEDPFAGQPVAPDIVRFVSVVGRRSASPTLTPTSFPATGAWLMKVLGAEHPFIFGMYRRDMKAVSYLGKLDKLFGCPVTTRNWNTIVAIGKVLG
ncbi:MAG TPA: DUF1697 domain-containing protein [Vicinamibacterales bacterium]|nr:DUF1697 domain-containing protein [Vicinamibacterales bacterium]